jgi:hypothetical protein
MNGSENDGHYRIGKTGVTSKVDLESKAIDASRRLRRRPGLVGAFSPIGVCVIYHRITESVGLLAVTLV